MEQWVKDWLEGERKKGVKCLEVKTQGKNYYVYHSTTYWDKERKKPRKTSKYLGKLNRKRGLIKPGDRKTIQSSDVRSVSEYGNSMLLHKAISDLKPLLIEGFPDYWEEIYALAIVRVTCNVPLKRVKDEWEKLYNAESIEPGLNPKNLSEVLHNVGVDKIGQEIVFRGLLDQSDQLVYDLSTMFSRSMNIRQAEKGYNKDNIQVPQIDLALLCSVDTGLPTYIRSLPGSVRDIKSLYNTINELDIHGKVLVLDRGFFSEDVMKFLAGKKINYVLPTRRNSHYYDTRIHLKAHISYHGRLILCGRKKLDDRYLYLFEDQDLKLEECKTLYKKLGEKNIDKKQLRKKIKKAGKIFIISNQDLQEQEVYELYKKRERIEKLFDSYKTALDADKLYLQDDESVFGHVFISFLSLYVYCKLEGVLKKAGLSRRISPHGLLLKYSKVYHLGFRENSIITEVPKKIIDLDMALELNIFPR